MASPIFTFARVNRDYPVNSGQTLDVWYANSARVYWYNKLWRYYRGNHWQYVPESGEPVITCNFVQKFVDKHAQYLMGRQFTIHTNYRGQVYDQASDLLNENWEKNSLHSLGPQMAQIGGVTGDCWVNVGLVNDPVFGEMIKYACIPSEYVFPIFNHASSVEPDAILLQWPDADMYNNAWGKYSVRQVTRGMYWTKTRFWNLEDGNPIDAGRPNILGELPFIHIANTRIGTDFFGSSDLAQVVEINREINEKVTEINDIVNYHSAPLTLIYGAKATQLVKGAKRVWSGLPKDARVENLQMQGDLEAANEHLMNLKDTLMQLGSMTKAAFGGVEAISNTSGVALALQFAPILEHMGMRRNTYGQGIQRLNYLALRFMEVMGTFKADGRPHPYYSAVKWPDPLPRDKQLRLQELQIMQSMQLLTRVRILQELIHNDIAPSELELSDANQLIQDALEEAMNYLQLLQPPPPGGEGGDEGSMTPTAANEKSSTTATTSGSGQSTGEQ